MQQQIAKTLTMSTVQESSDESENSVEAGDSASEVTVDKIIEEIELEDKLGFIIVADDQKINCEAMRLNLSDLGIIDKVKYCHDG